MMHSWRFIPTCVGNTIVPADYHLGFHRFIPTCVGNTFFTNNGPPQLRFIPTCVGNTSTPKKLSARKAVHPHVCGEYPEKHIEMTAKDGSSPRVWGIRFVTIRNEGGCKVHPHVCGEYVTKDRETIYISRFIPTCVGNTRMSVGRSLSVAVHPHVCGEYGCVSRFSRAQSGSSPRVWGIREV